ncbi:unnamed protein product [Spodoptera exigua]|nr:unnamed protein product [Spodoptera exigua]
MEMTRRPEEARLHYDPPPLRYCLHLHQECNLVDANVIVHFYIPANMMTRAKEMEIKLRAALKELESSKLLCDQLLQEREDNEVEVKNIINRNSKLKTELAELHVCHTDLLDQHNRLFNEVSAFQQCTETHEHALTRISQLEHDLRKAHNTINKLEASKQSVQSADTLSLYDELVGSGSGDICEQAITIDLTGDDTIPTRPVLNSHNKIKNDAAADCVLVDEIRAENSGANIREPSATRCFMRPGYNEAMLTTEVPVYHDAGVKRADKTPEQHGQSEVRWSIKEFILNDTEEIILKEYILNEMGGL